MYQVVGKVVVTLVTVKLWGQLVVYLCAGRLRKIDKENHKRMVLGEKDPANLVRSIPTFWAHMVILVIGTLLILCLIWR